MIIFLSELQKEHLNLLHQLPTQVVVDFCKLTIEYLNNGVNEKKISIASEKLDIPVNAVQNLVHALSYLVVEACKCNLSDADFKSSLAIAGFSPEHQEVLSRLYVTKKVELSGALYLLQQNDPTYQDFTWRFEVQLASKTRSEEIKPMVTMNFAIMSPKNFCHSREETNSVSYNNETKSISSSHINSSIQDAKTASHCQNIINNVLVCCDIPNLLHLTNKLEQALKESKSQHVRKVQRAL